MKIEFIKSPTGKYNLSYEVGEVVDLPDTQAKELIEDKYAVQTKKAVGHDHNGFTFGFEKETAESRKAKEKR